MSHAIEGLEPQLVWKYFAEIAKVPRCSKHEEKIRAYILATAKRLGLKAREDKTGNIVAQKPASAGKERVKPLCLQGHLDMVCEKNKGKTHDFAKDPIELVRKGNMLMANGTTLGADNGIAVATFLAIMEDKSLEHGPLEFLFTIDEETGLTGATNLEGSLLQSRTMMNLDSEEEGSLYVGCSGGRDTTGTWTVAFDAAPKGFAAAHVMVSGLKGGHSGLEIHQNRGNAIKIMNRTLLALEALGARLSSMEGGNKRNAIPRECEAVVYLPAKIWDEALKTVTAFEALAKAEVNTVDPGLRITIEPFKGKKGKVLKKAAQKKLLATVSALPHGVIKMSADIPGLTETSTNVAVISMLKGKIALATSQRSSVDSEIHEICDTVHHIFELGGAAVKQGDGYPGWKPNLQSPILKTAKATYKQLYGKEPEVKAIHAGLECGIIGEKVPGMDMVSFGPTMEGVHSPDEKIHIDTVDKYWKFVLAILRNVN